MKILAGLGLFFFGIKMVTGNLSAIAGDHFRRGLQKASERTGAAILFGATAGFVTQSGRTTSFILASFIQVGLIGVERALPIVLWANFGCTLVIFTAVFPIYLFALFLLAVAGVCVAFERPKPLLGSASATFGLALMLFGMQMMSSSAPILTNLHWFATALAFIKTSLVFAFAMGLVLTFVAQSHIAIVLIAITLATRGIFDLEQTVMVIFGAYAGSSLITYVTGIHFRGQPRQVVTAQFLYSPIGLSLFLPLFVVAHLLAGHGEVLAFLPKGLSVSPGTAAALVALAFNTATPLLLTIALPAFRRLCARLTPPLEEEDLGKPQFLREEVGGNAVATLLLAEQEQLRLLQRMPAYMAWSRGEAAARTGPTPEAYHQAFAQVGRSIERFQSALTSQRMTAEDTEWLLNQQKRQELLGALDEACHELHQVSQEVGAAAEQLRSSVVEALDTMLLTAISGMANGDDEELAMLDTMTRDRGPTMERMRGRYLAAFDAISPQERSRILQITSLFERTAWSLHRFGALLRQSPGMAAQAERTRHRIDSPGVDVEAPAPSSASARAAS
ncbi:MAG: Na/Pi symporter [Caulobacteraceae bacterium]|nr:Na/Pi symporter [Caulobacteraceae bacterium]